jgi:hypothetical protein
MANGKHLAKIKEGVEVWNAWRKANAGTVPDLHEANLRGANLSRANLSRANLRSANLREAEFYRAELRRAELIRANLRSANLSSANLRGADLRGADLRAANLGETDLTGAQLIGVCLRGADLRQAEFRRANLRSADLSGADLTGASIGYTTFGNNDLSDVKGLEELRHVAPSTIGIDTIYRSHGKIPLAFLRGAGVPENFIEYMRALTTNPIEFYSCFISYSTKDQAFADRLYADLQNKGVRCWFAPNDLRPGESMSDQIDSAIRLYDKLILVLSSESAGSSWVQREVEKALSVEHETHRTVLFPISLDDSILQMSTPWAEALRERFILSFSNWTDDQHYRTSLSRFAKALTLTAASEARETA